MPPYRPAVRCGRPRTDGEPCNSFALHGADHCYRHGGGTLPNVRAAAAVREAVMRWGFIDVTVDPGETLLMLVTQSKIRAQRYAEELERLVGERPELRDALIGDVAGEFGKAGEFIKGLVILEAQERDRCANFCRLAIAAGLAERQVRMAERQGQLMVDLLRAVMADPALGLTATQRGAIPGIVRKQLELVK